MIPVVGYAAKQAKGPLTSYTFKRRDPLDHDIVIDIQVLWNMSFRYSSGER